MISGFVREQKRYTHKEVASILHCTQEAAIPIIRKLKEYGVLKVVKNIDYQKNLSELADEDEEVADVKADGNEYYYVFSFVGVIIVAGRVLKCYPKYLLSETAPIKELKQVLKVIARYNRFEEQVVNLFNGDADNRSFNLLAVILYLLNDYYEYGLYDNTENVTELNGEGEIHWGKTIDENYPVISNGKPYYMEMFTRKTVNNEADYFHRLHQAILTECSRQLEEAQLNELFDIDSIELSDEEVADFGEKDFILDQVNGELAVQFNTRKQLLLKTMYAYIAQDQHAESLDESVSLFGTNAFNMVWEKVCAEVFNNMLQTSLRNLPLPTVLHKDYSAMASTRLIDIIEKPVWIASDNEGNTYSHRAADTLIPDLITISKDTFIIMDAKYYNFHMDKEALRGQPGIESITKQYLYQLAYKDFVEKHGFHSVKNCFLLPTEKHEFIDKGYVELGILHNLELENISARLIPADVIFEAYLGGRKLDLKSLNL